jgi:diaminohydroxyphosphoribosylaminopyrimidine deaminase / 5-amino-6-(5-phosphoribosylamino)uracil reductase
VRLSGDVAFRAPLRVVLDARCRVPRTARVFDLAAPALVFHARGLAVAEPVADVEAVPVPAHDNRLELTAVMSELAARGVNELQVEAGPTLCGALFSQGLVDELLLYVAPVMLGDNARPLLALPGLAEMTQARRLRVVDRRQVGDDERLLLRW